MKNCKWMMMGSMMPLMMLNMAMAQSRRSRKSGCSSKSASESSRGESCAKSNFVAQDIVDTAVEAGVFNRLVEAVKAAGLVETLKSSGPFTLFAPTDEAFGKVPQETLESLLKDSEKLKSVLTYHLVQGRYQAAELGGISALRSVEGSPLSVDTSAGVKVGNSHVLKADLLTSNGVIHVIDSVLIP